MKIIVAGSRHLRAEQCSALLEYLERYKEKITEIVSGGCKGPDIFAEEWARKLGIRVTRFLPDWKKFGRGAGPLRNKEMATYSDFLIAFWDGRSQGTRNMIDEMAALKKPYFVHIL